MAEVSHFVQPVEDKKEGAQLSNGVEVGDCEVRATGMMHDLSRKEGFKGRVPVLWGISRVVRGERVMAVQPAREVSAIDLQRESYGRQAVGVGNTGIVEALVEDTTSMDLADVLNDCGLSLPRGALDDHAVEVALGKRVQKQ